MNNDILNSAFEEYILPKYDNSKNLLSDGFYGQCIWLEFII